MQINCEHDPATFVEKTLDIADFETKVGRGTIKMSGCTRTVKACPICSADAAPDDPMYGPVIKRGDGLSVVVTGPGSDVRLTIPREEWLEEIE